MSYCDEGLCFRLHEPRYIGELRKKFDWHVYKETRSLCFLAFSSTTLIWGCRPYRDATISPVVLISVLFGRHKTTLFELAWNSPLLTISMPSLFNANKAIVKTGIFHVWITNRFRLMFIGLRGGREVMWAAVPPPRKIRIYNIRALSIEFYWNSGNFCWNQW